MKDMTVASVSMNGYLGEPDRVRSEMTTWLRAASEQRVDLAVFPELLIHGHCAPNTSELAEPVPNGTSTEWLCEMAAELDLVISVGLSERDGDEVYNTSVLVGPDGYIGRQRKLHMSRDEADHYKPGASIDVYDIGPCRVATVICYDNKFPEIARVAALRGAEVILMPHAGRLRPFGDDAQSQRRSRQFSRQQFVHYSMRARENAAFAIFTDQAGRAGDVDHLPPGHIDQPYHAGGAMIFAPDGILIAEANRSEIRDEMIVARLNAAELHQIRDGIANPLNVRRHELFGPVAGPADSTRAVD